MDLLAILNLDDVPPYGHPSGQPNSPSQESTPSPRTPPRYCALAHLDDDEAEWSVGGHSPHEIESRNRTYENRRGDWRGPEIGHLDSQEAIACSDGWILKRTYSPSNSDSSQQLSPVSWRNTTHEKNATRPQVITKNHPSDHRQGLEASHFHPATSFRPTSSATRNHPPFAFQTTCNHHSFSPSSSENMAGFTERLPSLAEIREFAVPPCFVQ